MFIDVIKMFIAGWLDLILMTVVLVTASHQSAHTTTQCYPAVTVGQSK